MDAFTAAIQKYLRDSDKPDAAQFLEGCIVENRFKDLVSSMVDNVMDTISISKNLIKHIHISLFIRQLNS